MSDASLDYTNFLLKRVGSCAIPFPFAHLNHIHNHLAFVCCQYPSLSSLIILYTASTIFIATNNTFSNTKICHFFVCIKISMEVQQFISGLCPKSSSVPSIPITKRPFSLNFPTLPSFTQSQKNFGVSSGGAFHSTSIAPNEVYSSSRTRRKIWCKSSSSTMEPNEGHEVRAEVTARRKKLAVFVSGGGSNFKSIHEASKKGSLNGDVLVLVTNKSECGGAEYARNNGIPVILFPKAKDESDGLSPSDLVDALRGFEVDFVLLAGYLRLIPVELIQAYQRSILNIHPSLLPAFGGKGYYGMKVHKAVIASGARFSGPTIHFVDEHFDTGSILAQHVVPVLANDTAEELAARVLRQEHQLYVEVVEALCEDRIVWRKDGVPLIRNKEKPNEFH